MPLTSAQRSHFLQHGYLHLPSSVSPLTISKYMTNPSPWVRMGWNPDDPNTWKPNDGSDGNGPGDFKLNRLRKDSITRKQFFEPRCWEAICEIVGGEEKIELDDQKGGFVHDDVIANVGTEELKGVKVDPRDIPFWHTDGTEYERFLDSPERGLILIVLMSDVLPDGGPTCFAEDSIGLVSRFLAERPEGWAPRDQKEKGHWKEKIKDCQKLACATGKAGDVYLMHPFLAHTRTTNPLRIPRFIKNTSISLKEPMRFDKPATELSLVEQKIVQEIGQEAAQTFKITGQRQDWTRTLKARIVQHAAGEFERVRQWSKETGIKIEMVPEPVAGPAT